MQQAIFMIPFPTDLATVATGMGADIPDIWDKIKSKWNNVKLTFIYLIYVNFSYLRVHQKMQTLEIIQHCGHNSHKIFSWQQ